MNALRQAEAGIPADVQMDAKGIITGLEVCPVDKMKVTYEAMLALAAEMVLDEALRAYRKERIYAEIDRALEAGDEDGFLRLTEELKTIC